MKPCVIRDKKMISERAGNKDSVSNKDFVLVGPDFSFLFFFSSRERIKYLSCFRPPNSSAETLQNLQSLTTLKSSCPFMPVTLEGGGTVSKLSNVRSCTGKGHSQFDECKTINFPSTVYSLRKCDEKLKWVVLQKEKILPIVQMKNKNSVLA